MSFSSQSASNQEDRQATHNTVHYVANHNVYLAMLNAFVTWHGVFNLQQVPKDVVPVQLKNL